MEAMLMMTPPPCCIICRPAHLQPRKAPVRLMPTTVFQPLAEMSSGLARNEAPALFTMMSSRPHSATARSTMALTWSSWRTSSATAKVRRPRSRRALVTGSRCSSLREQMATSAPARANSSAIDLPMPVPPPVTIAVLPSRANGFVAMASPGRRGPGWGLLGQGDLALARRHLALDAPPDRLGRQARAVAVGAALELVHERVDPPAPAARRLGRAPHVVVRRGLRLDPRLLEVGQEQHDPVHLAVDPDRPLRRARKPRAGPGQHVLEVPGEPLDLAQVVRDARARLVGRPEAAGGRGPRPQQQERERGRAEAGHEGERTAHGPKYTGRQPGHRGRAGMVFKQYYLGCLSQASYLIGDERTGTAAVVDPRRDVDEYLADAEALGLRIEHAILTHFHADFVAGHLELRDRAGARIHLGGGARAEYAFAPLADGARLEFGDVRLEALETPGHTPEGISLLVYDLAKDARAPQAVLTGDTLFIGDVGRPDLMASAGVSARDLAAKLYESVHTKLLRLPAETLVYPGHGAGSMCGKSLSSETVSTIEAQRRDNYALQPMGRDEFVRLITSDQPDAPEYFAYDAELNRRERPTLDRALDRELAPLTLAAVLAAHRAGAP